MAILQFYDVDLGATARQFYSAPSPKNLRSIKAPVAALILGLPGGRGWSSDGWDYHNAAGYSPFGDNMYWVEGHARWPQVPWVSPDRRLPPHATAPRDYVENHSSRVVLPAIDRTWLEEVGYRAFASALPEHLCLKDIIASSGDTHTVIQWKQSWLEEVMVARIIYNQHNPRPDWKHYTNAWLAAVCRHEYTPAGAPVVIFDADDERDMALLFPRTDLAEMRLHNYRVGYPTRKRALGGGYLSLMDLRSLRSGPETTLEDVLAAQMRQTSSYSSSVVYSDAWRTSRLRDVRQAVLRDRSKDGRVPAVRASTGRRVQIAEDRPVYGFDRDANGWVLFALDERLQNFNYIPSDPGETWPNLHPSRVRALTGQCNSLHLHYSEADKLWRVLVTRRFDLHVDMSRSARLGMTMALTIRNEDCVRRPLYFTPPRGMPKHIATAIRETPFMASAINHALVDARALFDEHMEDRLYGCYVQLPKNVIAHTFPASFGKFSPTCQRWRAHNCDMRALLATLAPVSANSLPTETVQPVAAFSASPRSVDSALNFDDLDLTLHNGPTRSRRRLEL